MEHQREFAPEWAHNCTTVVQVRTEASRAAEIITRWWQEIKSRKQREQTLRRKTMRKSSGRQNLGRRGVRRL
jgi:hypothetical protein